MYNPYRFSHNLACLAIIACMMAGALFVTALKWIDKKMNDDRWNWMADSFLVLIAALIILSIIGIVWSYVK